MYKTMSNIAYMLGHIGLINVKYVIFYKSNKFT